jgi:hypothetical protein
MTDTRQDLSLITLAQNYRGDTIRQINRRTTLLRLLEMRAGSGKNVAWAPEASGQLAENYAEGADAANFASDAQAAATLSWGLYRGNFHLSQLAMDAAATSGTPLGNEALFARNLVNATTKLASTLNVDLYTGAGTGTLLCGLDQAIGSISNTYATIARGSNSYWQPNVFDPGSATTLTLSQIRADLATIKKIGGTRPDWAMVSPATFVKVVGLFDATRRYVQDIKNSSDPSKLDAGYQVVEVDGTIFVEDKDAPDGAIYYLNRDHCFLEYLPSAMERALMAANVQVDANDGYGLFPLGFHYHMLAKNGPSERAEVLSTMQLCVDRPNTCGKRLNVDVT